MLVSPGHAAPLGSRSLSTIGIRSRVCHAPNGLRIPLVRRGLRSDPGIYRATTKCLESIIVILYKVTTTQAVMKRCTSKYDIDSSSGDVVIYLTMTGTHVVPDRQQ